jgi:hypothetical protein
MRLGKVVKSNSHCDYVVQLDDSMDLMIAPRPDDYGFGTFVKLEDLQGRHWAVGIVYNSQLLNPAFNSLGPRLSSEPDLLFTPDLIAETRTLLWTVLVGNLAHADERPYGVQGIPRVVVPVNTPVYTMSQQEIQQFHSDPLGRSQFTYYSHLLRSGGSFAIQLAHQVLSELVSYNCFAPDEQRALNLLCRELAWKNTMGAMR